jgi:hypothetical protein
VTSTVRSPCARSENLIVEELGEELLVYDMGADRGHCLSPTAARVWRHCDGHTSVEGLSARLDLDADAVDRALEELAACKLLEPTPELAVVAANGDGATRRELATKAVKAGAVAAAAPLIVSVAAPTPAQAQTLAFCRSLNITPGCGLCQQGDCCCCEPAEGVGKDCVPDTPQGWFICCATFGVGNVVFSSGCTNPGNVCEADAAATESTQRQFEGGQPATSGSAPPDTPTAPAPEPPPAPAPEPPPVPEAPPPETTTTTTTTTTTPTTGSTGTEAAPTP